MSYNPSCMYNDILSLKASCLPTVLIIYTAGIHHANYLRLSESCMYKCNYEFIHTYYIYIYSVNFHICPHLMNLVSPITSRINGLRHYNSQCTAVIRLYFFHKLEVIDRLDDIMLCQSEERE